MSEELLLGVKMSALDCLLRPSLSDGLVPALADRIRLTGVLYPLKQGTGLPII